MRPAAALALIAFVVVVGVLVWRLFDTGPDDPYIPLPVAPAEFVRRVEDLPRDLKLVDVTAEAGIRFRHHNGARGRKLLPETMGGGCAFLDFDNDGDQDLVLVNSAPWPDDPSGARPTQALYENDGTGKFEDVTARVGLDIVLYGMGVAVGDYDGDGDDDIYLTAVGNDRLLRNDGGERFVDVTREVGLPVVEAESFEKGPHPWSTSAAFLDFDNDGRLDIFVCRYVTWSPEHDLAQGFQITGLGRAYGPPTNFEGTFCRLHRNVAGGFEDVSAAAGIEVRNPNTGVPLGKSLGVSVLDMDRDGWVDIVVANDTVQNFLFHNQRDGTFEEIGAESGVAFDNQGNTRGAMGIDWARVDPNGTQAIVVGNFANEITALYISDDPLTFGFTDDAEPLGIGNPSRRYMKFGVFFFDLDLDGRLDIFEANGHLENEIQTVQSEQRYRQPAQIFWNAGPGAPRLYEELRAAQVGPDIFEPTVGRGCAYADVDGDGDLDIVVVANDGPARLFRNDGGNTNGWIRLKLEGRPPNTNAFGARVEADVAGRTLHATVSSGRSYLSQCEQPVTFGLGDAPRADAVRIWWPGAAEPQQLGAIEARTSRAVRQP